MTVTVISHSPQGVQVEAGYGLQGRTGARTAPDAAQAERPEVRGVTDGFRGAGNGVYPRSEDAVRQQMNT